jgi:hypothetical protein
LLQKLARLLCVSESYLLGSQVKEPSTEVAPVTGPAAILADYDAPPGLRDLAADSVLSAAINITDDEWHVLRSLDLPCTVTKEGYIQLLVTLRTVCRA